jgi:hypothetical protein
MDKDRVAGSAKQVKGAVKEAVGKVVGDAKLESVNWTPFLGPRVVEFKV